MPTRIIFPTKQQVALESFELPEIGAADVRVRTLYTLMSTGTENIVFNGLYEPGTHWDNWVKFPFHPGYLNVGQVEAVGADVSRVREGDYIFSRKGHCSEYIAAASEVFLLPAGFDLESATWFGLAKIAAMGARSAQYQLGDGVLIIGAGPIGQMSLRWAAAGGAENLVVLDTVAERLEMAKRGGATATFALSAEEAVEAVQAACGGVLPRVVVETTGIAQVFPAALKLAANFGRVVILGDTGFPSRQHLTSDVIRRGLTIVGSHDTHETAEWNTEKIFRLFVHLVQNNRFDLSGLIRHRFKPAQCEDAYCLANERRGETMGILYDWR
jgi:2-desacetyl-2-hydroxyethyl bacteriochlorophyllide A dehydrogenase